MKITAKLTLHFAHHAWLVDAENISILHVVLGMTKNYMKQLCKKSFENKLCKILHTHRKELHAFINCINQTLTFISWKLVYFKSISHIKYSTHRK